MFKFIKTQKNQFVLVLMPCANGAYITVLGHENGQKTRVIYSEEITARGVKDTVLSFIKAHKKQLSLHLLLDYADYELIPLEDKGILEPELSQTLPWEATDFLPYLPEQGRFFYFQSKREKLNYVFSFHLEKLIDFLGSVSLSLEQFESVNVMDCAWANYMLNISENTQALCVDIRPTYSRLIYIESSRLEAIHIFDPIKNEMDAMNLGQYIKDGFLNSTQDFSGIYVKDFPKNKMNHFVKTLGINPLAVDLEQSFATSMAKGIGLYHVA